MLDFVYQSGWGAFTVMLFFQIPFAVFFLYMVFGKSRAGSKSSTVSEKQISRLKTVWLTVVAALFVAINLASIQYIPAIATARAENSGKDIVDVDVTAVSWSYEISRQEFVVGTPVRFSAKSIDTVHGFAVYHPDGRILFTLMLIPGVGPASLIYTFNDPGTYKVRCLEYCGAAHHEMSDELIVKAAS